MDEVRRSVLDVAVVVETTGSQADHDRAVMWAAQRIKSAHMRVRDAAVAVRITGPHGKDFGFAGHGEELSAVSRGIIDDFFDEDDDANAAKTT